MFVGLLRPKVGWVAKSSRIYWTRDNGNHWVGFKLAVNSRVEILRPGQPSLWRRARADGSYGSSNDPRVFAGLGSQAGPVDLRVIWPSGRVEKFFKMPADHYTTLKEGSGAQ